MTGTRLNLDISHYNASYMRSVVTPKNLQQIDKVFLGAFGKRGSTSNDRNKALALDEVWEAVVIILVMVLGMVLVMVLVIVKGH